MDAIFSESGHTEAELRTLVEAARILGVRPDSQALPHALRQKFAATGVPSTLTNELYVNASQIGSAPSQTLLPLPSTGHDLIGRTLQQDKNLPRLGQSTGLNGHYSLSHNAPQQPFAIPTSNRRHESDRDLQITDAVPDAPNPRQGGLALISNSFDNDLLLATHTSAAVDSISGEWSLCQQSVSPSTASSILPVTRDLAPARLRSLPNRHGQLIVDPNSSSPRVARNVRLRAGPSTGNEVHHGVSPAELFELVEREEHGPNSRTSSTSAMQRGADPQGRKRFRRHFDPEEREQTAKVRRVGACIYCRYKRKTRCIIVDDNPNAACQACSRNFSDEIGRIPCLRYKISDALLFLKLDRPPAVWTDRWRSMNIVNLNDWAPATPVRTIEVTQDVGRPVRSMYLLRVRKFIPKGTDSLNRYWVTDGVQRWYPCTPYAIVDIDEATKTLQNFVDDTIETSIKYYLEEKDQLLQETYLMALKYSQHDEVSRL